MTGSAASSGFVGKGGPGGGWAGGGGGVRWRFYGPDAVLVEFGSGPAAARKAARAREAAEARRLPGLVECVPGFGRVLLVFDPAMRGRLPERAGGFVERLLEGRVARRDGGRTHEIPVVYDGPDLGFVAEATGLTAERVIALHSRRVYTVEVMGFTPGFPYLGPLDRRLRVPRRAAPRLRVAPGSVAIGGPHTGIYSVASPGGWHLIGRTNARLFEPEEEAGRMFLLAPGDRVRFVPVETLPERAEGGAAGEATA